MLSEAKCCISVALLVATLIVSQVECQLSADEMQPIGSTEKTCSCGQANRRTRIIGGQETEINEFPWMCESLVLSKDADNKTMGTKLCGGALIDRSYVVTAAHCFKGLNASDLIVDLGDHSISRTGETVPPNQMIRVSKLIIHPQYNPTSVANDIALLKLATPCNYSKTVLPACLPPPQFSLALQTLTLCGYGATQQAGPLSDVPNKVDIPTIPNSECKAKYKNTTANIDDSVMCAGVPDGSKDSCQGDSGSPAVVMCNSIYTFCGIVSFGVGCGNPLYPGVLTNVSYYVSWIVANAVGASLCIHNCRPTPQVVQECGIINSASRKKRVVGGGYSLAHKYPWMVAIYIRNNGVFSFACGGTLISKDWVLTTARCVRGILMANLLAVCGAYDLDVPDDTTEEEIFIKQVYLHPNFTADPNNPTNPYDVALLQLNNSAVFDEYVSPICLPPPKMNKDFGATNLNFCGWGRIAANGSYSGKLKEVNLRTMNNTACKQVTGYSSVAAQPSIVCTESSPSADVCDGDSGGSLMTKGSSGRYYAAAINTFRNNATGKCGSGYPSGNVRIPYCMDWITKTSGVAPYAGPDNFPL